MDAEKQLFYWNTTFEILSGALICRFCFARQRLVDAEQKFLHAEGCQHSQPDSRPPWVALHDILDRSRG